MYQAFFGLTASPFSLSPDPAFLYRSTQHDEALANLVYGVQSHKGFIVLTGEVGTGKTTMLECLRDFLAQRIALRCTLRPFEAHETAEYIATRLAKAGIRQQTVFSSEMLAEIHYRSQGLPRLINSVCGNLPLTAFAMETKAATLDMLDEVTRDLRLDWPREPILQPAYQESTLGDTL